MSVNLGIGPECVKYYSKEVLESVRRGDMRSLPRHGSKREHEWLAMIREAWGLPNTV